MAAVQSEQSDTYTTGYASQVAIMAIAVGMCCVAAVFAGDPVIAKDKSTTAERTQSAARIADDSFSYPVGHLGSSTAAHGWSGAWRMSSAQPASVISGDLHDRGRQDDSENRSILIRGSGRRNNPLRRQLAKPQREKELFVRFYLRYEPDAVAEETDTNGEFFVLWLDRFEGTDRATHSSHVPNIGVRVAPDGPRKGKNLLIVRIGSDRAAWSRIELIKGQTYNIVGRLWKTQATERGDYDQFDLWVDPQTDDFERPDASAVSQQSISLVRWIGFATGLKTEHSDRILVDDLVLSRSWEDVLGVALTGSRPSLAANSTSKDTWTKPVVFRRDIFPLLKSRCFACHSGINPDSGKRLDVHDEVLGISTGIPLAEPGRSSKSRIIELVTSSSVDERMPPEDAGKPLTAEQVALLRAWIDQGVKWDEKLLPSPTRTVNHWAFEPIVCPPVPPITREGWKRTPVDAFVAARHESTGLKPLPPATRRVLVRRVFLDLIGMPPTPDQVDTFINDDSPQAYADLIEQLLKSEHYGERWARYWLDLARWAESHGYQHDLPRPYAWRYRDYVIDSFNSDKPYDRFLKEQIAGDELQPHDNRNLIATGFLAAARISGNQMDKAIQRNDVLVDIVNTTASAILGLTLSCAQCHNHKFDPLSQRDYYRMQAFFITGQLGNLSLQTDDAPNPTDFSQWMPKATFDFYLREAKKLENKGLFKTTGRPHTWGFYSPATGNPDVERMPVVNRDPLPYLPEWLKQAKARLLIRGDVDSPGPEVTSGWPAILDSTPQASSKPSRTALADWMASRNNPLVSRIWVNRIWQYHFGRGLVTTPSDFGTQGARPSHPDLLDWLAAELMDHGWSTKHIHRQIVLSSTYRQSRHRSDSNAAIDPENVLLWSWPRRRLEAEAIRDSLLVATGELDHRIGGPSVPPAREESELRRTIYLYQRRSETPSMMAIFDAPEGIVSCSRRNVSTVALQPLFMLNSRFMTRRADALAAKVRELASDDPTQQVRIAFLRTLGRPPEPSELSRSLQLLNAAKAEAASSGLRRSRGLAHFCHALLNLNEFVYIP